MDTPLASAMPGPGCPPAAPSDHWYRGLRVRLGDCEGWKPQKVGGCRWARCPRNSVLSHVTQDTARAWFRGVGAYCAAFGAFRRLSNRKKAKRRQKAPKSAQCAPTPRNQAWAVSWATWLKIRFRGHLVHPQPPTFCDLQASESPKRTPRPPYQWSLRVAGGQHSPRTAGANGGPTRVPGAKTMIFFKVFPRPLGMPKQVFFGCFEPVGPRFGPCKVAKCLGNGRFQDQKWVENGSKMRFSNSDSGPFAVLKQVFLAHFEPVVTRFAPWKTSKCLENGSFWDQKWVKNESKTRFIKSDPGPFRMLKQVEQKKHFQPVLTEFSPFHHRYALRTYLRAVWWSHPELGRGV